MVVNPLFLTADHVDNLLSFVQTQEEAEAPSNGWHPVTELPLMFPRNAGDEQWEESPRLLLSDQQRNLSLGFCTRRDSEIAFDADDPIGPVAAWMLAPIPSDEVLKRGQR